MRTFLVTDRHIYHDNIIKYCNRPANHTEVLHSNWRKLVTDDDLVYDMGDVIFGKKTPELCYINQGLPGKKILILGNHDRENSDFYLKCGYDAVLRGAVVKHGKNKHILLTHKPFELGNSPSFEYNIHGHLHNLGYRNIEAFGESYALMEDYRHILLSMELIGYKPIELHSLIDLHEKMIGKAISVKKAENIARGVNDEQSIHKKEEISKKEAE